MSVKAVRLQLLNYFQSNPTHFHAKTTTEVGLLGVQMKKKRKSAITGKHILRLFPRKLLAFQRGEQCPNHFLMRGNENGKSTHKIYQNIM